MNKKKWWKKEKQLVIKYVDKYKKRYHIDWYKIYVVFDEWLKVDCTDKKWIYAETQVENTYLYSTIYMYWKTLNDYHEFWQIAIEEVVAHELAHILTEPFYNLAINRFIKKWDLLNECEKLTQQIAMIWQRDELKSIAIKNNSKIEISEHDECE